VHLDFIEPLDHDVYAVDTGFHRPGLVAAYLIVDSGRAAIVDTGANSAVPRLLAALQALGLEPDAVDWVIPTHVHLDHAGGAGLLMRALPRARLAVHPRGAPHMVDPGALHAGATAVYGPDEMARTYGELLAVDSSRVTTTSDGMTLALAGRTLEFIDTPGHARHHHCIWDARSRCWFTGDTFGISYPELTSDRGRWILPTGPPVQFDPEALKSSVRRLMARDPAGVCLTHFGRVDEVPRLGALLLEQIDEMVAIATQQRHSADRHAALKRGLADAYARRLAEHGFADVGAKLALLALDIELNAQGLGVWLDRSA
jgi:glyoxylase-like metal-dependent hydrolase (beta-lactamase superfamily II)